MDKQVEMIIQHHSHAHNESILIQCTCTLYMCIYKYMYTIAFKFSLAGVECTFCSYSNYVRMDWLCGSGAWWHNYTVYSTAMYYYFLFVCYSCLLACLSVTQVLPLLLVKTTSNCLSTFSHLLFLMLPLAMLSLVCY